MRNDRAHMLVGVLVVAKQQQDTSDAKRGDARSADVSGPFVSPRYAWVQRGEGRMQRERGDLPRYQQASEVLLCCAVLLSCCCVLVKRENDVLKACVKHETAAPAVTVVPSRSLADWLCLIAVCCERPKGATAQRRGEA